MREFRLTHPEPIALKPKSRLTPEERIARKVADLEARGYERIPAGDAGWRLAIRLGRGGR